MKKTLLALLSLFYQVSPAREKTNKTTLKFFKFLLVFSCLSCKRESAALPENAKKTAIAELIADSVVVKNQFYNNLSKDRNFKLAYYEKISGNEVETHYWDVVVYDKKMTKIDSVRQPVGVFFASMVDFTHARSYETGINENQKAVDNYYGDFVVADFNFDGKSDFAIINDMGGNGGPFYSFYLQERDQKYVSNAFLQDSVTYFPTKINRRKKMLTTYVHAGVCGLGEHQYQFNQNKWSEVSHKLIDICKDKKQKNNDITATKP